MSDLKKDFLNPGKNYRSVPFWSWNDKLSLEELVRQAKDMKEHGLGGFFMHSREGLETDYLSGEWMRCVKAVVQVSRKIGMNAWLYDEDRWPSGSAGGRVPSRGDKYREKALGMEEVKEKRRLTGEELTCFCMRLNQGRIESLRKIDGEEILLEDGELGLVFTRELGRPREWFNNETYADNLNPESVQAFMELTYEVYKREVGDEFGKTIPGIFTDEPNVSSGILSGGHFRQGIECIPWTDGFAPYFETMWGYDFLDFAPYFFFDGERSRKVRHDYWLTVTRRFQEAYSRQLGEWCEKNSFSLTGHYLFENDFPLQIRTSGAVMPHYVYQRVPGIDLLTESIHETLTVKQCSSVANQFGRNTVLSEMYGCSGWEFSFEGQKWVGDWQYVLGVTLRCQHLTLYTLKGCRKRDFPPSFNYNTTWWKYNKVIEDYFARLSSLLTKGKPKRDILLLHPITSAWSYFNGSNNDEIQKMSDEFQALAEGILGLHYDFDLGDELIIKDYAKVRKGTFLVNRAQYKTVIIPPMRNIESSTLRLLEDFLEQGGTVLAIECLPELVDGEENDACKRLCEYDKFIKAEDISELAGHLERNLKREISIKARNGLEDSSFLYLERKIDEKTVFFVVNLDRNSPHRVEISLGPKGIIEEWDPLTGKTLNVPHWKKNGYLSFSSSFAPAGSKLFVVDPEGNSTGNGPFDKEEFFTKKWQKSSAEAFLGPHTEFKRTQPNVLVLDKASYRFSDGEWSKEMPIWRLQREIRERLGMRPIHINGIAQRYLWCEKPHPNDGTPVSLRILFEVEEVPDNPVYLVLEQAKEFDIKLNNKSFSSESTGWFLDRSLERLILPPLTEGVNELVLSSEYLNRMELEDCFLIGDFAVDIDTRAIIKEPERLHFGDWTSQGYPHYAGSIFYEEKIRIENKGADRFFLKVGTWSAASLAIWINGELTGHIPWRDADGMEITGVLREGENTIAIEVVSSPRNMLGPLHRKSGYEPFTDSQSFRTEKSQWTDDYVLWPWGPYEQVRICRHSEQ